MQGQGEEVGEGVVSFWQVEVISFPGGVDAARRSGSSEKLVEVVE